MKRTLKEWALFYASLGWAVFPIRPGTKKSFYSYPEFKNPETGSAYSWKYQATSDPERVRRYWTEHPEAGIGCATGQQSGGLYVLDLDKEKTSTKDGAEHFREWQAKNGKANTKTPVSVTGSGGRQLFFHSAARLDTVKAAIYEGYGVDTRGDGGFVVLPPSTHPNGNAYAWKRSPEECETAEADELIKRYWKGDRQAAGDGADGAAFVLPATIGEGGRTAALVQYAGQLVKNAPRLSEEELRLLLEAVNGARCVPPLSDQEMEREVLPAVKRFRARIVADDFGEPETLTAAERLPGFFREIKERGKYDRTPTGFVALDFALGGGLYPGLYVLGAISSLGKTSLMLQIADQVAAGGRDVLYFSLEMSRDELMAKSLSRHTFRADPEDAKTARAILSGETDGETVQAAVSAYSTYADRLYFIEGVGDIGVSDVRDTIRAHMERTGNTPVIFLDYLQVLKPFNDKASDKQNTDHAILELRRLCREFRMTVFAISSFNRESYSQPVSMSSFKESGSIEYGSDVLLALQPQGIITSGKWYKKRNLETIESCKRSRERLIEAVILKNRSGETGGRVGFEFNAAYNYFVDDPLYVHNEPYYEDEDEDGGDYGDF